MLRVASARVLFAASARPAGAARFSAAAAPAPRAVSVSWDAPGEFATVTLSRPHVKNAFDGATIEQLLRAAEEVRARPSARGAVVRSTGPVFCAGGDLAHMRDMARADDARNLADAAALSSCLHAWATLRVPTIALVQGPAFGGGVGLVSVCDIAVAASAAVFSLSEVRLGLVPATISPYVVRRIGPAQSRRFFMTAERFDAERAMAIGLVHEVVDNPDELDAWADRIKASIRLNAPSAVAAAKELVETCVRAGAVDATVVEETAQLLARLRRSPEAKEGLAAFLEKRKPNWAT
ncbi:enoyl-CoA hydratase/isomerase [Hyaloraphidium curvatum]|nr:enoyl-CoA hydratase/isomerase [Hyaloraphidium curvatum]